MLAVLVTIGWAEWGAGGNMFWRVLAILLATFALVLLIPSWLTWWTTEIAVTNHRLVYNAGLICRTTTEIPLDKVDSVDIEQSLIGRLLGYGSVTVHATGTGFEPLQGIASDRVAKPNYRRWTENRGASQRP
jgi:uncharacterized membrane protein YdbT with pleckstrin-like domain